MKTKTIKVTLLSLLLVFVFASSMVQAEDVKIIMLNSKGEIQSQLETAAKLFSEENPGINLEVVPAPVGQSPYEKAVSMYASGNAPTLAMLDPGDMPKFKDKFLDLSDESWASEGMPGALNAGTIDGKVYGFPLAVEGHAFIYNKEILDEAVGGNFSPDSIRTRDQLEQLFKDIEENTDAAALVISPMDWSLGAHLFERVYSSQAKDMAGVLGFLEDLKAGKVDLADNEKFTGLLKTFDVMKEYNIDKNDPLSGTYDRGPELIGQGKVGIWYMGNWAWPPIKEFDSGNTEYGFIPVPMSNDPDDYANSKIIKGSSKFIGIDKEQSTVEEQEAAKKFLKWLIYSESGQNALINEMNVIPAFKSVELEPKDPLAKSIISYMVKAETIEAIPVMPADHWSVVGASLQKYLADYTDVEGLAKEVEAYWKNVD